MASAHVEDRNGVYYIHGTRISLDSIVYAFREGCSPETIREDFEGLSLAQVYGAVGFYLDHQADIDSYLLQRKKQWLALERQGTPVSPDLMFCFIESEGPVPSGQQSPQGDRPRGGSPGTADELP